MVNDDLTSLGCGSVILEGDVEPQLLFEDLDDGLS